MAMSREEEGRYLERLERELPGLQAKLSQAQAEIRGKNGKEKAEAQKKAFTLAQEVGGMKNTIKALKGRLGKK
jgi:predicted RNase H-like nuclease (RuvC/YqgF family)